MVEQALVNMADLLNIEGAEAQPLGLPFAAGGADLQQL